MLLAQEVINYHPVRANNRVFVTLASYELEASEGFVVLGVGDFTPRAQPRSDQARGVPPKVPGDLLCVFNHGSHTALATAHVNGTAYQGIVSPTRGALYFGERLLWINCPAPQTMRVSSLQLVSKALAFDSLPTQPVLAHAPTRASFNLTLCTSAVYGLTGSRWLVEWLEHHRANGFDSIELYIHDVGPLVWRVINYYRARNSPSFHVRVLNWTSVFDTFSVGNGVGYGVSVEAWEHGQRMTRNDCYLRNRGRSRWIMFSDVDELFSAKQTSVRDVIQNTCERANAADSEKIACSFTSVTVPPNALPTTSEDLLVLERIDHSESHCHAPYNCGEHHYGRQKYAIRTASNTLLLHTPLFYHAISRDYTLANRHHVQVPRELATVRHYAGHFAHSRRGGLKNGAGKYNPIPAHILDRMRAEINRDRELYSLYHTPGQSESFLKLDALEDTWRFAKPGERPPARYLTFDYFAGRLNNQLWTLDWVMRLALSLNRTAVLPRAQMREHFIGWPESATDASLWDLARLRQAPFRFLFHWEVPEEDRALVFGDKEDEQCVWEYSRADKYVARWAHQRNALESCTRRLHIASGQGLIHAYKVDTRSYAHFATDALVFWRYMRPNSDVQRIVSEWMTQRNQESKRTLGLHWRTWREAHGDAAHATKVCKRLSEKIVHYAGLLFETDCKACGNGRRENAARKLWEENDWFALTCHSATVDSITRYTKLDSAGDEAFFVATDHETRDADEVFESMGARMLPIYELEKDILAIAAGFETDESRRFARSLLPILLDLQVLLEVDRFVGSPASTLSHAVCLWRRTMNKAEEEPGMCQLVWWSTFSDLCEERVGCEQDKEM